MMVISRYTYWLIMTLLVGGMTFALFGGRTGGFGFCAMVFMLLGIEGYQQARSRRSEQQDTKQ